MRVVEWVIFCVAVGCVSTAVLMFMGRRWGNAPARETGVVVEPSPSLRRDHPWSLVGAAVMPSSFGKVSATWPLGFMDANDHSVVVRIRPGWLGRMFGAQPMRVTPADDVEVFPARGWFGTAYIGIRAGDRECYFMCSGRAEVMGRLQASGYRVTSTERKIVYP
jgi:hypothetical protein